MGCLYTRFLNQEYFDEQTRQLNIMNQTIRDMNQDLVNINLKICELREQIKELIKITENHTKNKQKSSQETSTQEILISTVENENKLLKDQYYVVESASQLDTYYLINKDKNECTCPSYSFSENDICKHILNHKYDESIIFNIREMKCSCQKFKLNNYCVHSQYFKENGYGQYTDEQEAELDQREYYVIKSTNEANTYYLINKDFSICTCPSYIYSQSNPKTCKHIQKYMNYDDIESLPIYFPQTGKCSCSTNKCCEHNEYFILNSILK